MVVVPKEDPLVDSLTSPKRGPIMKAKRALNIKKKYDHKSKDLMKLTYVHITTYIPTYVHSIPTYVHIYIHIYQHMYIVQHI